MEQLEFLRRENERPEKDPNAFALDGGGDAGQDQKQYSNGKRNPPARNTSRFWFERFLSVIQRQNPSVIDASFLKQIAPSNEGKLLAQLKFLRVIDAEGKPTELLPALNMVGQEQRKAFQQIAQDAYSDLLSEVMIEKAVPDDLLNFFIRKYSFTRDKAIHATKFFLYLAEKGSLAVSPELSAFLVEKSLQNSQQAQASATLSSARTGTPRYSNSGLRKTGGPQIEARPVIQATINITLDRDTPKEYWERIFALLGGESQTSPAAENQSQE